MAFDRADPPDIWLLELSHGASTRFTFDPSADCCPLWSPDGSRIVFLSGRDGPASFYQKALAGGKEEPFLKSQHWKLPSSWSPDGRFLMYAARGEKGKSNLWLLPLAGDRKPVPLLQTEFNEEDGQFSPDARFVAYVSDESGQEEVYVQAFPPSGMKWQISTAGGSAPRWRRDGRELFYLAPDRRLMAVEVRTDSGPPKAGAPRALFHMPMADLYAVSRDGQRFLVNAPVERTPASPIKVVVNWTADVGH